jgi:hypothetical protein
MKNQHHVFDLLNLLLKKKSIDLINAVQAQVLNHPYIKTRNFDGSNKIEEEISNSIADSLSFSCNDYPNSDYPNSDYPLLSTTNTNRKLDKSNKKDS